MRGLLLFLAVLFLPWGFAQEGESPFRPTLPVDEPEDEQRYREEVLPPQVTVQGVLWDSDKPLTIIDGDVYGLGETLRGVDATVYKIEKSTVFLFYKGQLFKMGVEKSKSPARRRRSRRRR